MTEKELLNRKERNINHSFSVEKIFSDRIFWVSGIVFTLLVAFHEKVDSSLMFFPIILASLAVIFELISLHYSVKSFDREIEIVNNQIKNPKTKDTENMWGSRVDKFSSLALLSIIFSLSLFVFLLFFNFISHEPATRIETAAKTETSTT